MSQFFETSQARRLAYSQTPATAERALPGVVFLGGFRSNMQGTKAMALEDWARRTGRAFLRFDYSGHGQSSERFEDGCLGDWAADAKEIIGALTDGPQILIGSSMGGWISLLIARDMPEKLAGLVTIAAAPDFSEDSMWAGFSSAAQKQIMEEGHVSIPSDYGDPYVITRRFIEDGRQNLVLRQPLQIKCPARFLQGTRDEDVSVSTALRLLEHAQGPDLQLLLVDGADHRFSDDKCLDIIFDAIKKVTLAIQ